MLERFQSHIQEHHPRLLSGTFIIAISAGLDSAVLAHLCRQAQVRFTLAHCNFKLRGEESDGDERFVRDLAQQWGVPVHVSEFQTQDYARDQGISIQMAARALRYQWFGELLDAHDYEAVLTAHHAQDNLETFMINLSRGSGLDGLTGIPRETESLIRPLLPFTRDDLEAFAKANQVPWREDSSNANDDYLRNKLRHQVLPAWEQINPELTQQLQRTQDHLRDARNLLDDYIALVYSKVVEEREQEYALNIDQIKALPHPKAVLYELLHLFGFTNWEDVYQLLDAQSGKQLFSDSHRLIKDRTHLLLTERKETSRSPVLIIDRETTRVDLPDGTHLHLDFLEGEADHPNTVVLDADRLEFPLLVRKWQQGDYFYPLGMQGKKKVSKYFKDEKVSLPAKERAWLLCDQHAVVWILGYRMDDRFKMTEKSSNPLTISYTNA
ncbi:tRNA lysidine(34) synthetase TilS [Croceiramulus getboli]|nr:tRNA lysidine(34) synthetase TilS [Flavobacteriaceae bacterium YJPT1-3]